MHRKVAGVAEENDVGVLALAAAADVAYGVVFVRGCVGPSALRLTRKTKQNKQAINRENKETKGIAVMGVSIDTVKKRRAHRIGTQQGAGGWNKQASPQPFSARNCSARERASTCTHTHTHLVQHSHLRLFLKAVHHILKDVLAGTRAAPISQAAEKEIEKDEEEEEEERKTERKKERKNRSSKQRNKNR